MKLLSLKLKHFRNYITCQLQFPGDVNVFVGENAQGKTNLLEAIYMLALAKSHRTSSDKEIIHWSEEYAKIEGRIKKRNDSLPLELVLTKKGKKARANHLEKKKLSDYIGILNVVMFAPEDLNLVKGPPALRRRFIDMEIGQVHPVYMHDLSRYNKLLSQRNALLKELQKNGGHNRDTMLDVLTEQLTVLAGKIAKARKTFVKQLERWAGPIHASISQNQEQLAVQYESSIHVSEEEDLSTMENEYERLFRRLRMREIERGVTLVGPHRDDLSFFVNEKNVQIYGSQGQQRTTALALKLAEIELIEEEIGEYPLLLLDDVLSELDDARKTHLLQTIQGKVQTFVTTTSADGIDENTLNKANLFCVKNGSVEKVE